MRQTIPHLTAAFLLLGPAALADSPLPPARDVTVQSPSGRCVARSTLDPPRTTGARLRDGREEVLWSLPGYRRFLAIADDCQSLIAIYGGYNLLGLEDRASSTVVFTLHSAGKETRQITLGDIYADLGVLKRTVSHWQWVERMGWQGDRWLVDTVDGRTLCFQVPSGERCPP